MFNKPCVTLITGAAQGNGAAIATKIHSKTNTVILIDIVEPKFQITNGLIPMLGSVSDKQFMEKVFSKALEISSNISLVNNAGITRPTNQFSNDESWKETLEVNLTAPFHWLTKFTELVKNGTIESGSIVNVCSLASHVSIPDNPAYVASKHGLLGLTKAYAEILGPFGIMVNSISPGYIHTNMTEKSFSDDKRNKYISNHTMLNKWGQPNDVAQAVEFLLDSSNKYITGVNLAVDGGWLAKGFY
jgi:2-deoxy-D-gluconate 3-dehydrogenase